mmetsp:Transcript_28370/g.25060  ORF Transcript_28370/g.25060 Transcript_28370/m.25060 type:complete len:238 (-) Transcript_28370:106-819(-)
MGKTLSLCCCGGCCKYGCCCTEDIQLDNASNLSALNENSTTWKTGDILLERYTGAQWKVLQSATDSQWTHVGVIYNNKESGNIEFIEITMRGVSNYEIKEHAQWFLGRNKNHYMGHRKLNQELTEEQLEKFKQGYELLKNKEYGGAGSMVGAACDCTDNCCGGCCITLCNDKANENERLQKLFCSELCAELLQRAGVMKTNIESDEYTPGDFDGDRPKTWLDGEFQYDDIVYYKGTD